MSIKIAFINPPQIFSKSQVASGLTPPLGVAYLASYLLAKNIPVQVINALGETVYFAFLDGKKTNFSS